MKEILKFLESILNNLDKPNRNELHRKAAIEILKNQTEITFNIKCNDKKDLPEFKYQFLTQKEIDKIEQNWISNN